MRRRTVARVIALASLLGLTSACSDSTAPSSPPNIIDIDVGVPTSWILVGTNSPSYSLGLDTHSHSGRYALAIGSNDSSSAKFSGVGQLVKADNYRGKRVRLSAWIRTISVVGTDVGLWMRVDGVDTVFAFDNFSTRSLSGTADWQQVSVILDVPVAAQGLVFGALMSAKGEILVDDMSLTIIPASGSTTDMRVAINGVSDYTDAPTSPANLDFEAK